MADSLDSALAALDVLLRERRPQVHATLRAAAGPEALAVLARTVGPGGELPPAVVQWFGWHDGQSRPVSFSTQDNYFLHSIESAVDAWEFLTDPAEDRRFRFERSWLPLFENGAGDHRVLDLATGELLLYDHAHGVEATPFRDLTGWASAMCSELERLARAASPTSSSGPLSIEWSTPPAPPSEDEVREAPLGTAYFTAPKSVQLRVKTAEDTWLKAGGRDESLALAQLREHLESPPGAQSGFWETDWEAWRACTKGKATLRAGRIALDAPRAKPSDG